MAIIKILATIHYTIDTDSPNYNYAENPTGRCSFTDCYRFDTDRMWNTEREELHSIIKQDLREVAGFDQNIHSVTFEFSENSAKIQAFEEEVRAKYKKEV